VGFTRQLQSLLIVVATAFLVLTFGVTSASAASKTRNSTSQTIGTCIVITHPTATLHTDCVGASLQKAPLSHADLSYAVLTEAKLNNANLSGANLTGATLTKAVLTGANLAGVQWSSTTCPDGTNSDAVGYSCSGHLSTVAYVIPPSIITGPNSSLPYTGFDPWPSALTGSGLIAIGVLLLELAGALDRRRSRPQAS
jgi:Pentapeptide repeats (8 copies)